MTHYGAVLVAFNLGMMAGKGDYSNPWSWVGLVCGLLLLTRALTQIKCRRKENES